MYARVKTGGLLAAGASVAGLIVFFFLAGHPEKLGSWALKIESVLPAKLARAVARLVESFAQGLAIMRRPGQLLGALALSFPLWLSIALGIWVTSRAFHMTFSYVGSFLVMTLLVVGVARPYPWTGGRISCGLQDRGDDVFQRAGDDGGGRSYRAARDFVRARDAARARFHGPRRAQPGAHRGDGRS
jgi:hypothetical protein